MILVDTSVLIGYFKNLRGTPYEKMDYIIDNNIPYGINDYVYQEILQGAGTNKEFFLLKEYLSTMTFYDLKYGRQSFENAALIYIKCRKSGITVRSTLDLMIAEIAIENNLYLLHNDSGFSNISGVIKDLKTY